MLNIPSNNKVTKTEKEIEKFKNKKYLAARHETDKHIRFIKSGTELNFL